MKATIHVSLKHGVLDPQGKAIEQALHTLGFTSAQNVRQGKFIELDLNTTDTQAAKTEVEAMCQKLLANPVVENFRYELHD